MATEHNVITDGNGTTTSERHEPKGASIASSGQVYVSDGAASGDWRYFPHGACYYSDIGTGTSIVTPTSFTLVNPTTTGDVSPHSFTHNSAGRLTYTGTETLDFNVNVSITLKQSTTALTDVFFQVYVNGAPAAGGIHATAALSANYQSCSLASHVELDQNDYVEIYTKTASGNVVIHAISVTVEGKV